MAKRWSKTEIAHLRRHAGADSIEELALRLHTDGETVRRKLAELGLDAGGSSGDGDANAALAHYTQALQQLHDQSWEAASELLERVIVEADGQQLADRARQYLEACARQIQAEPADEDPYLRAVFEKNDGNLEAALDACRTQAADDERYAYLMASIKALMGEHDEALDLLAKSIELEPKNRVHAYHDPDFHELRGLEEFSGLVAAAQAVS